MKPTKDYIIIGITSDRELVPFGSRPFQDLPRRGELIEIEDDKGVAFLWEVMQVLHSAKGDGSDIYVANPQQTVEWRVAFRRGRE